MTLLRTVLVSAVLGTSLSSFAAMPDPDPAGREARMEEALQHFHAKQDTVTQDTPQAQTGHHAKHHRHAKPSSMKPKNDASKAKDQTKTQ